MRDYSAKVQYVKVILAQSSFLDHSLHLKLKCDNQRREGVQIIWVSKWLKGCTLALGRKCICAESSHLSPAAQAVGGRVEARRAPPSAVGKVPRPTHLYAPDCQLALLTDEGQLLAEFLELPEVVVGQLFCALCPVERERPED